MGYRSHFDRCLTFFNHLSTGLIIVCVCELFRLTNTLHIKFFCNVANKLIVS
jgi:hypothetical protein